jgi:hypothetical protein
MKSEKMSTTVFPLGRSVLICFLSAALGSVGPSRSFHLQKVSDGEEVIVLDQYEPSQLDETFVILKPRSVLDAPEVTVLIIVQDRRDFRRPNVRVVEVPALQSVLVVG